MNVLAARSLKLSGAAVAGVGLGIVLFAAQAARGPAAMLALGAIPLVVAIVLGSGTAVLVTVVAASVIQSDADGVLGQFSVFYRANSSLPLIGCDVIVALLVGAAVARTLREASRLMLPAPFVVAIVLLGAAIVTGMVTGYASGVRPGYLLNAARGPVYMLVVPVAVLGAAPDGWQRGGLRSFVASAMVTVAIGAFAYVSGTGHAIAGDHVLTYFGGGPLWILMAAIVSSVAAIASGTKREWWVIALAVAAAVVVALSLRRSIWIGTTGGIVIALVLAVRSESRTRLLVGAGSVLALCLLLATAPIARTATGDSLGPINGLAKTITDIDQERQQGDEYRVVELRNVEENLGRHPLTGLGFAVQWTPYTPLPVETADGRTFTHVAPLWWWMTMGGVGLLAYVLYIAVSVHIGLRAATKWRGTVEGTVAIGIAVSLLTLTAAELTGTQRGVDVRLTLVISVALGWLLVLLRPEAQPASASAFVRS